MIRNGISVFVWYALAGNERSREEVCSLAVARPLVLPAGTKDRLNGPPIEATRSQDVGRCQTRGGCQIGRNDPRGLRFLQKMREEAEAAVETASDTSGSTKLTPHVRHPAQQSISGLPVDSSFPSTTGSTLCPVHTGSPSSSSRLHGTTELKINAVKRKRTSWWLYLTTKR